MREQPAQSYLQDHLHTLQRSVGNQAVQRLLALGPSRQPVSTTDPAALNNIPVIQREEYEPRVEDGVTVGKTYAMKANWYAAAQAVLNDRIVNTGLTGELGLLRWEMAREAGAARHRADNNKAVIDSDELEKIFPVGLPATLYNEIAAATHEDVQTVREDLRNAYIRQLNNSDWKPIERQIDFGSTSQQDLFTSTITPVNKYYHETYGPGGKDYGTTGLNSMSSAERLTKGRDSKKEDLRTTNLAHTELRRGGRGQVGGEVIFAAFRSGALSGKNLPQGNTSATRGNTRELLEAMTIKHLQGLSKSVRKKAFNGKVQKISVTSISLQSAGLGGEKKQINEQLRVLEELGSRRRRFDILWKYDNGAVVSRTVYVKFNIIALNLGVNAQGLLSNKGASEAIARLRVAVDKYLDMTREVLAEKSLAHDALQAQPASTLSESEILAANIGPLAKQIAEIEIKNEKIKVLWAAIEDGKGETRTYKMAARIANLAFLLDHMVHFNCKSGKDRTGLMDAESKHLALRLEQLKKRQPNEPVPREEIEHTLTQNQQASYQKMLFESGSLEMQAYNTGGQGYKIAPAAKFLVEDKALMDRVGGQRVLTLLQGLKRYTDIDKI